MNGDREIKWHERQRCYGIDRETLTDMREANRAHLESRLPAGEVNKHVGDHLKKHGRSTARCIGNKTGIFIPDIRQALARLVDMGHVERDGDIWEKSTQTGHRFAAAYVWKKKRGPKKSRQSGKK
jgi:predicted transcriptional regulator